MSKKPHNVGLTLKNVGMSVDGNVIRKPLPKDKRKWPGLKKGSGQLPDSGVGANASGALGGGAAEGLSFAAELLRLAEEAPALENITAEQPVTGEQPADQEGGEQRVGDLGDQQDGNLPDNPDETGGDGTVRYVKGAHLIYKREADAGQFEELWIYTIDPNTTEPSGTPLKAILAGTDIPENGTQSEDGTQSYSLWTAGNAQYVHIKGLPN